MLETDQKAKKFFLILWLAGVVCEKGNLLDFSQCLSSYTQFRFSHTHKYSFRKASDFVMTGKAFEYQSLGIRQSSLILYRN